MATDAVPEETPSEPSFPDELRFEFFGHIAQGYRVEPTTPEQGEYAHYFCGQPTIEGAECPNCRKLLLHMLTIDTHDPRLGLEGCGVSRIPLLFCWDCAIPENWLIYRIPSDGQVEVLAYTEGSGELYETYGHCGEFEGYPVRLEPISEEQQWFNMRMNRWCEEHPEEWNSLDGDRSVIQAFAGEHEHLERACHQIGGEPRFVNPWVTCPCPLCNEEMPFLALIEDQVLDPGMVRTAFIPDLESTEAIPEEARGRSFSDNNCYQMVFNYCRKCRVVGAIPIGT